MTTKRLKLIKCILKHRWLLWPRLESLQLQEDVWRRRVLQLEEGEVRDFAYAHYVRAKRLKIRMKKRLGMPIWEKGVCEICGCTDTDPCFNPYWGTCWWVDEEHTLCSHCDIYAIQQDPETRHCIHSNPEVYEPTLDEIEPSNLYWLQHIHDEN